MQQRLHVAFATNHGDAVKIRDEWRDKDTKTQFQIRRRRNGFEVVGRVSANISIATKEQIKGNFRKRQKPRGIYHTEDGVNNPITYNNKEKRKNKTGKWTPLMPDKFSAKEVLTQQLEEIAQERDKLKKG